MDTECDSRTDDLWNYALSSPNQSETDFCSEDSCSSDCQSAAWYTVAIDYVRESIFFTASGKSSKTACICAGGRIASVRRFTDAV